MFTRRITDFGTCGCLGSNIFIPSISMLAFPYTIYILEGFFSRKIARLYISFIRIFQLSRGNGNRNI